MARIRSLKPELWQDEAVGACSHSARLLFIGLITQADDEGRLAGAKRLLWSLLYPWEDYDPDSLEEWLTELVEGELIQRYESRGRDYIALPTWKTHQRISHPTASKLPKPRGRPGGKPKRAGSLRTSSASKPEDSTHSPEDSAGARKGSSLIGEDRSGGERNGSLSGSQSVVSLAKSPSTVSAEVHKAKAAS